MILVTGATGNVGRPLVHGLEQAGVAVRGVSRRDGVDLLRPESLPLDGVEAVFLMTPAEFLAEGDLGAVMKVVREAGVRKVVLLSSQGVGTGRHPGDLEEAVTGSGVDEWAVLRPGNFDSNALQWARSISSRRLAAAPFGDVGLPAIDPADIAEVAKAALLGDVNGVHTLTGPAAISPRQQVAAIADVLGEPVRFVEQSRAEAREEMLRFMPEPVVEATLDALGTPTADEQRVSPDVERLLGRAPRSFAEWVDRSVAAFR